MKYAFIIGVLLWGTISVCAQNHATCDDAIPITTSSYGPVSPEGWADSSLCVPNNENMYFGKSHLVIWFSFVIPYDTVLTFKIVPETPGDDFDFMLFKASRGDFCQKEKERKVKPIRTNFAKPAKHSRGITGLSTKDSANFVRPGFNSPYSAAVHVKKGEWFYLAVDSYIKDKAGFTLKIPLQFNVPKPVAPSAIDAAPVKAPPIVQPAPVNFYIHVLDSSNHPVKATLTIDGASKGKSIEADTTDYALRLAQYHAIIIRANSPGYMPYQSSYFTSGDTSAATFWVHLVPIKSSQKIVLKDIEFKEDSPIIISKSKSALDYLLQFLISNPSVKIIIKGYTNDPDKEQTEKYDQILSEKRANAIKDYLAAHGVNRNRMNCIGYGRSKMLYPHPKNKEEEAANRRVEVEIQ